MWGGYFCWGVSTPLHAMPSLSKKHDDITIKVNGITFSNQKLVVNKFNTNNLGVGGGIILPPCWFSLNNSETVKAATLEFCSIQ